MSGSDSIFSNSSKVERPRAKKPRAKKPRARDNIRFTASVRYSDNNTATNCKNCGSQNGTTMYETIITEVQKVSISKRDTIIEPLKEGVYLEPRYVRTILCNDCEEQYDFIVHDNKGGVVIDRV